MVAWGVDEESEDGAAAAVLLLSARGHLLGWSACDLPVLERSDAGWGLQPEVREALLQAAPRLAGRPGPVLVRLEAGDDAVFGCLLRASELPAGLTPMLSAFARTDERALALVLPGRSAAARLTQLVQENFGLTPAEARIAVLVREGLSLCEAAERLSVSVNTVRNQLRAVFDKMGLKRQSDLVRVLTQLCQLTHLLPARRTDGAAAVPRRRAEDLVAAHA